LILLLALSLACNLSAGQTPEATPAPAPTPPPTPSAIPTEPPPASPAAPTAAPEDSLADLTGPARPANTPGEWLLYDSGNSVYALLAQGDNVWAGTSSGIVRWEPATGQYERFTAANGLNLTQVFDLAVDSAGQLWAAGWEGLAIYDGATWQHIPQSEMGLPDAPLRAVAIHPDGTVWAGGDEYFDYSADPFYIPEFVLSQV
jgi:ligand-binding sensor domain-containing protein